MKKIISVILCLIVLISGTFLLNNVKAIESDDELNKEILALYDKLSSREEYDKLASKKYGNIIQELYNTVDQQIRDVITDYESDFIIDTELGKRYGVKFDAPQSYLDFYELNKTGDYDVDIYLFQELNYFLSAYINDNMIFWKILCPTVFFSEETNYLLVDYIIFDVSDLAGDEYIYNWDYEYLKYPSMRRNINEVLCVEIKKYISAVEGIDSPYTMARIFSKLICDNMYYLYESYGPSQETSAHNILGLFYYGKGVCETYAQSFYVLMKSVGIDCLLVLGETPKERHAWNMAKMNDGNWYWFDITWCDDDDHGAEKTGYLCLGDEKFKKDHTPDLEVLPIVPKDNPNIDEWYTVKQDGITYKLYYNKAIVVENANQKQLPETITTAIGEYEVMCLHSDTEPKDNCTYCLNCVQMIHKKENIKAKNPTCTEEGTTKGSRCSVCGYIFEEYEVLPALGHNETDWIIEREPTKDLEGYKYKECLDCFEITQEEYIPKLQSDNIVVPIIIGVGCILVGAIVVIIVLNKKKSKI